MKKILFVALAAVGMTACVQNEELVVAGGDVAIAFENAYVYNATKADNVTTTTGSITGFDVWAYMDEVGGTVLTDEDVTKNGGTWGYTNIQYWMPKHTYYFAALSPMNSANVTETLAADPEAQLGLGTVAFTNVDGTEDLLYAKASVVTPEQSVLSTTGMDPVKLQFQHLLSKVRFTFKNGFSTDNMKVTVSNVEMSAPKSATIDLAVADYAEGWVLGTEKFNLQFGSVEELAAQASAGTAEDRLTIPAAATEEYTVTFDVVVKSGSVVAYEIENMTATIKGYQIKMGCAYNFIAEITPDNLELKPIEFTAQVDEWDYAHGGDEHQAAVGEYVYDVAGLQAKIDAAPVGKTTICLGADIVGDVTVLQKEGVNLIIDGNGYKYDGVITVNGNARAAGKETLTFQNIAFETTEEKTFISAPSKLNNKYNYSHNVTVKDCTFTGNWANGVEVGGISLTGTYNAVVDGCVATGMHSLAQFQSCDNDVLVSNVTVTASKNGVSFGNTARPVLRNAQIEAECYGVRADGNASRGALIVENSNITATQPIIVRKVTTPGYSLKVDEATTLTTDEKYAVVFTKYSDDVPYALPEVAFTYSVPADASYVVYPNENHKPIEVTTATAFVNAINNVAEDGTIVISEDFDFTTDGRTHNSGSWYDGVYYVGDKSFTIDLGGNTVGNANGAVNDYLFNFKNDGTKANTITIKNGTLDAGTAAFCALCTSSTSTQELTINLENVNLINNISNGSTVKLRGHAVLNVKAGTKITGKNSYLGIECVASTVNIYDGAEIYQNGTSSYLGCLVGACGNGVVNVYGGYGKSVRGGFCAMTSGGTINIAGGEWIANTDGTIGNNSNVYVLTAQNNKYESGWCAPSIINVTGGTLRGGMDAWVLNDVNVEKAELNISGGNFNANPKHYLAEGYAAVESNGVWNVIEAATVSTPEALATAVANGGYVVLAEDVALAEALTIENTTATIDLNGKTLTAATTDAIVVKSGANVTISGNGKVSAHAGLVRALGGKVTIEGGEFVQTGDYYSTPSHLRYGVDSREGGEIIVKGGTFNTINGMINVNANSSVVIEGGNFNNAIQSAITRHFAYVGGNLTIKDGVFESKANGSAGGTFFCGAGANGKVVVEGGKFTSLWVSGSKNNIWESYFGGSIEVKGGIFNHNGGIKAQVTDNTDAATKDAYPYMAK